MAQPERKTIRLKDYDYSTPGWYFITICTKGKEKLLCQIVGTAVPGGPQVQLTGYGKIVDRRLREMSDFYDTVKIDKFVVMPNHIHLLIHISEDCGGPGEIPGGPSGTTVPTSVIGRFVGTFKRLCNRECGKNIWQSRSYDHIIRNEADYQEIWTYIDQNPAKWREDRFYVRT